ncbi:hypothetical protein [Dyadobacter sp. CY343]|uniref:hypothetical protein n=1 Tax=Dyadobacter sp. CY343 TaxID=2907299 RepID=UPI001F445C91|nr:hypothetical protein [Dyadobacter sp. CY343]MCE7063174.1 hypothetical protein [Dyadobacter sp. CY343]
MKKFTRPIIKSAFLFCAVLLLSFSCEDHTVPEVLPVLKTLPITQTRENPPPFESMYTNRYRLVVENVGNVPVSKYGIVFTTYRSGETPNPNKTPTVDAQFPSHVFPDAFGEGEKSFDQGGNYPLRTDVYQRAYAILADGRIIYGDVVWTVAGKVTPIQQ